MLRILLIDDNFDVHLSITRQLKQEFSPIEVTSIIHAKSFEEALAYGDFDIAITDYCFETFLDFFGIISQPIQATGKAVNYSHQIFH